MLHRRPQRLVFCRIGSLVHVLRMALANVFGHYIVQAPLSLAGACFPIMIENHLEFTSGTLMLKLRYFYPFGFDRHTQSLRLY